MHRNSPLPELPEPVRALQPLIARLLAKDPADRFENAAEAARELDAARTAWLSAGVPG